MIAGIDLRGIGRDVLADADGIILGDVILDRPRSSRLPPLQVAQLAFSGQQVFGVPVRATLTRAMSIQSNPDD